MTNNITSDMIRKSYLDRLRKSKYNRFYVFELDMETLYYDGSGQYSFIEFYDQYIMFPLISGDYFHIIFEKGKQELFHDEMNNHLACLVDIDSMDEAEFWDFIYELTTIFSGAYIATEIQGDICESFKNFRIRYADIYVKNLYSKPYTKQYANINIHVNSTEDIDLGLTDIFHKYVDDIYEHTLPGELHLFLERYEKRENKEGKFISYYNDVNGDFYSYDLKAKSNSILIHCRDIEIIIGDITGAESDDNKRIVLRDILPSDDLFYIANRIRILLAGAGDISYKNRIGLDGDITGYDIYIEEEYDKSYVRDVGNITFHINAGYEHKTELERLKLYVDENNVDIRDFSCVPEMIMKPLQTTKATRYLCYKLIEGEINTLYFNGKDGDFYLKASRDTLMLHCRDMAFVFGESDGAKDLVEENDTINIFDKSDDDYNINDIFSIAYEMIFILAGAGEVSYEQMSDGFLKISLEKEYVEDYSRQFGKVIFDIKEEK